MKNKIKILRIIARLNLGGPAIHVILLSSGLDKNRFSSCLVTGTVSEGEQDITDVAKKMGIEPLVIPELTREIRLKNDFAAFLKLYKLMKRLKPDIVHTHTAKAGALGRIAAIINRVPIKIHTFHGHIFHSYFNKLSTRLFLAVERLLARFTNRIIVISESQLNEVKDVYKIAPDNKFSVVPLGLDLDSFLKSDSKDEAESISQDGRENIRDRLSIQDDTLLVGIVGRLAKVKNHKMFLDVAKRVSQKAPEMKVKFVIVGDGALRGELESYVQSLNIENLINFMGWSSGLKSLYKSLDVVCLTSLNEGTPISLIEAMASGRAVLSTDVGGVRDVVVHNETGVLNPSGDIEKFSDNLLELLRNKNKREELGRRAKRFVSKKFSKERLFKDIENLYEEEMRKRRRP